MEQANANGSAVIKQRIHRSEEEIFKHLKDQEESDISVKDNCGMFDINEATFYSWVKKYRKIEEEEKGFTTIEIIPTKETKPSLFCRSEWRQVVQRSISGLFKSSYNYW